MTEAAIPSVPFLGRYPIGMQLHLGTQRCDLFGHRSFYIQSTHDILLSLSIHSALWGFVSCKATQMIGQHTHSMQQPASSHGSSGVKDRASATTAASYGSSSSSIAVVKAASSSSSLLDENTGEEGAAVVGCCEVGVL